MKQCTEAPSNKENANFPALVFIRTKGKRTKASECDVNAKKEKRVVFKALLKIEVLIALFGIITQCHFPLLLMLFNARTLLDTSLVLTKNFGNVHFIGTC